MLHAATAKRQKWYESVFSSAVGEADRPPSQRRQRFSDPSLPCVSTLSLSPGTPLTARTPLELL
jgi:hypothetical protein